jgi:hypothetical protein
MLIFKKRRPLGFGVFIVIWSVVNNHDRTTSKKQLSSTTTVKIST